MNYISGTVTYFNSQRGFGFITLPGGQQFFFHVSNFARGEYPVLEGQVEFQVGPPIAVGKRPQAVNVRYRKSAVVSHAADATTLAADALATKILDGGAE